MYLGPLFIGTAMGYFHALVAFVLSGSFLTALLTLMVSGVSVTLLLLVALALRGNSPRSKRDEQCHANALFQPASQ